MLQHVFTKDVLTSK